MKKAFAMAIILAFGFSLGENTLHAQTLPQSSGPRRETPSEVEQILQQLVTVGISVAGSSTLGPGAGVLMSGLSYKLAGFTLSGIKKVIGFFKGKPPETFEGKMIYLSFLVQSNRYLFRKLVETRQGIENRPEPDLVPGQIDGSVQWVIRGQISLLESAKQMDTDLMQLAFLDTQWALVRAYGDLDKIMLDENQGKHAGDEKLDFYRVLQLERFLETQLDEEALLPAQVDKLQDENARLATEFLDLLKQTGRNLKDHPARDLVRAIGKN